jgi:hypothetical protein
VPPTHKLQGRRLSYCGVIYRVRSNSMTIDAPEVCPSAAQALASAFRASVARVWAVG